MRSSLRGLSVFNRPWHTGNCTVNCIIHRQRFISTAVRSGNSWYMVRKCECISALSHTLLLFSNRTRFYVYLQNSSLGKN